MFDNIIISSVIIFCVFLFGFLARAIRVESHFEKQMVERGYGEYTIDTNTAPKTFRWKSNTNN